MGGETALKKDKNKIGDKSFFPSAKYNGISEIERKVDRILLENKDKLDKINLGSFDIEKFSLKNKDGKSIYFFRRNSRENLLKMNDNVEKTIDEKIRSNTSAIPSFKNPIIKIKPSII